MSILREAKEDKKALLLVLISGISLGMFLLMRCMHYPNLLLLLLLPACSFIYFLVWILYASILSRVKNSDVKQILRDDAFTYLPSLLLLPFSVFLFIKVGFYPGASPPEEHLKNTVFLFLLMTTLSLIISLKILVHGHFEWLTKRIKSDKAFYSFLSLVFILFSALAYLKLNALEHYGGDIAAYIQRIWFIIREGIPKSTIFFVPIGGKPIVFDISRWLPLYISAPFYLMLQNPASILIAQALFISITAIPVYWIGRDLLKSRFLGLLLALSFFLNPATQYLYLQAFHNDTFGMAFLAFALYFLYKRKALPFFIFSALMVVCKENFFLVGIFLGLYNLITLRSEQRITFGIPCLIFSILWAFIIFVVFPSAGGSEFFMKRYSYLGSGMGEALHTIMTEPLFVLQHVLTVAKIAYIGTLLFPLAFFPLFSSTIFIALPIFAQNLLSERYPMYSILYQYSAILLPVLYFSAIKAIYKLSKSDLTLIRKIVTKNFLISSVFLILLLSLTSAAIYGPFGYLYKVNSSEVKGHSVYFENFLVETKEDRIAKEIARQIPKNASVLVQEPFQILLAEREKIYMFPCYTFSSRCVANVTPERIDYIILNMNNPRLKNIEGWRDWIDQLESNSWRKIVEKDGFIVFKGEGHG